MSTILELPTIKNRTHLISVQEYHALGELGFLSKRTELIEGVVLQKIPNSPIHSSFVRKLVAFFQNKISKNFTISSENPLSLRNSEPEPDIAIVDSRSDFYATSHPSFAHLVIEISLSTLEFDRDKSTIYASAGIPEYWIFNLVDNVLEVFLEPSDGEYKTKTILTKQDTIHPYFQKEISISLSDFFS